jgi:manganese/zinc/iron transport system permease protein
VSALLDALFADPGRAIVIVGALVGIAATLPGTFLVVQRRSMLTDAISHSALLGIVVAFLATRDLHSPVLLVGATLAGVATVVLTRAVEATRLVRNDAAIALVFPALFALAVLLINVYARDAHLDTDAVLLGEIAFSWLEVREVFGASVPTSALVLALVAALNALFVAAFWKELVLASFDPATAQALGRAPGTLTMALLALTSLTAVAAFEAVGSVLFVAFVVAPVAAGLLLADRMHHVLAVGLAVAVLASVAGYRAAVTLDTAIGPAMALVAGACAVAALLASPRHGVLAGLARARGTHAWNDVRTLLAHLDTHREAPPGERENTLHHLEGHLGWGTRRGRSAIDRAARAGLVREGPAGELELTASGRAGADRLTRRRDESAEAAPRG